MPFSSGLEARPSIFTRRPIKGAAICSRLEPRRRRRTCARVASTSTEHDPPTHTLVIITYSLSSRIAHTRITIHTHTPHSHASNSSPSSPSSPSSSPSSPSSPSSASSSASSRAAISSVRPSAFVPPPAYVSLPVAFACRLAFSSLLFAAYSSRSFAFSGTLPQSLNSCRCDLTRFASSSRCALLPPTRTNAESLATS